MASRRNLILAAAGVGALVFVFPRSSAKVLPNAFETPGVKNIGDRYAAGGGSNTHLPGVATPRGNSEAVISNQQTHKGVGTPAFEELHADQKSPKMDNNASKAYRNAMLGNDTGK